MDYYKFGNTLCSLREEHGYTQKQLAEIIDVSDKAVSKWENGQAIPRMDTLERIAAVLNTSVEELIVISKDNSLRICIVNNYSDVAHIELDGSLYSIKGSDSKWIELDSTLVEHSIAITGELTLDIDTQLDNSNFKDKIVNKGVKAITHYVSKVLNNNILQADCTYLLTDVTNEARFEIKLNTFSLGDKAWINEEFYIAYPELVTQKADAVLSSAKCRNKNDFLRHMKKAALTSELGIDIPFMLLAFPFRMSYFKGICKGENLKRHIEKADAYNQFGNKAEKRKKHRHPILKAFLLAPLVIIIFFCIDFAGDVLNVETEMPALIASDYSRIELFRDEYVRIDEMPYDAIPAKEFGVEVWHNARLDGLSKLDQTLSDNKVTIFEDTSGKKYLWLVCDYIENITDENGEYIEFKDFESPMVYEITE